MRSCNGICCSCSFGDWHPSQGNESLRALSSIAGKEHKPQGTQRYTGEGPEGLDRSFPKANWVVESFSAELRPLF